MKGNSYQSNSMIAIQGLVYLPHGFYLGIAQIPYLQTYEQMFKEKGEEVVKQEVKEEYDSESVKREYESESIEACKKNIRKFSPYIWPGETKNYYKNIGKKLASFITNSFDQSYVREDPFVNQFVKMQGQNYNRIHFQKLFTSKIARRIATEFFGNYQWCSQFILQNKTELGLYLRHNKQMYKRKSQSKK
ncbi:unnamed protein product (macronuclear) [Paramecium tetraurelia]|uniref:Uncharacterized protein n=1 Tax=Paramecium tetraurelia TaxID=5888 RepID=A0BU95_PARTE|nr:uncharacterized protein GSPATT00032344001 [Paramecium tetraurelia]CAK62112.1 unnamed protein product [Paramecium tetraurelia]|eukprot:XP_001429510.1 hypothetical protein (macronuclear) [Paramecium tetraurelia strain d4-2]